MSIDIKILGAKCGKCEKLYSRLMHIVEKYNIDANIQKIEDIVAISQYNSYYLPVLLIGDKIIFKGIAPKEKELIKLLNDEIPGIIPVEEDSVVSVKSRGRWVLYFSIFFVLTLVVVFSFFKTGDKEVKVSTLSYKDSVRLNYNHVLFQRPFELSLLEFGSGHCRDCIRMSAVVDSINDEFENIVFIDKINLSEKQNRKTAAVYEISLIPSQVILDRRGRQLFIHTGLLSYDSLKTIILGHLNLSSCE